MPARFQPLTTGERLSERVAAELEGAIRAGGLGVGERLPTEAALAAQFGVSRTVVREAVSRLKSLGLVQARQGSGVYVQEAGLAPLRFDRRFAALRAAVVQVAEVRRALEAEAAALAAQRRTAASLRRIQQAVQALEQAVAAGGDGVREDVAFHRSIAHAARNPFLLDTLQYLSGFLQDATRVTRANEAWRADFVRQVWQEHARIVRAIEAGDAAAARRAAHAHMENAIGRIEQAAPAFWQRQGQALARALVDGQQAGEGARASKMPKNRSDPNTRERARASD